MQLFIKAFNRTFYLARLLGTLRALATGIDSVIILDDGTPQRFLAKLREDYPEVTIVQAPHGERKTQLMREGRISERMSPAEEAALGLTNPAEFWVSEIERRAQDWIGVLEEDVWFVHPFDCASLLEICRARDILMYRLFWASVPALAPQSETFETLQAGRTPVHLYMPKVRGALERPKLFTPAQAIYRTDYWLNAFRVTGYNFTIGSQFDRSVEFLGNKLVRPVFAHSANELVVHGYSSTSRKTAKTLTGVEFNPTEINLALNEAWLDGSLDASQGVPTDFDEACLLRALTGRLPDRAIEEWRLWKRRFLEYYRAMGSTV